MKDLEFYFQDALKNGYAIGAFNFNNLETLKAICNGSENTHSPVLVAVSEGGFSYIGENHILPMVEAIRKEHKKLPIFLHLDHGKSFEICKRAVDAGFDSVMFDGSSLSFEENVKITKKVVQYAHKKGVFVEAELGVLAGIEDTVNANEALFTNPQKAKEFVEKTGCNSLAVAVGTSHGAYKYKGKPKIRFDILEEIQNAIPNVPLVLHGASSVPQKYIKIINKFGGEMSGAAGTDAKILSTCAKNFHICKINTDTDMRLAYISTVRKHLAQNPKDFDIRNANLLAIEEMTKLVEEKNRTFNCENRVK